MAESFFEHPILNSPYEYPGRHWELDESGQPTNRILDRRRNAECINPLPKPNKRERDETLKPDFGADKWLSHPFDDARTILMSGDS